jgi:hypothetical protein
MGRLRWVQPCLALAGPVLFLAACGGGATGPSVGSLALTVSGLPTGMTASITVTGPGGYSHSVTTTETLSGLEEGTYTVASQPVTNAGTYYSPLPASQVTTVTSNQTASASVNYSATETGLNLRINGLYVTQSVQTLNRDVPLVTDRNGFLRVFVTASQAGVPAPVVRVRLFSNSLLILDQLIDPPGLLTPQSVNQGSLSGSWNLPIPKSLIQPNLAIQVEVDPDNTVTEVNESDNVFPMSGVPLPLNVRTTSPFQVTLVPVQLKNNPVGNVSEGNKNDFLAATMKMHPLPGYDVVVGGPLQVDTVVDPNNDNKGWNWILTQVEGRRIAENTGRNYFGVVNAPYSSGVAGVGFVGGETAVGWDKLPSASNVAAHEWGHNWGRQHAPCGGASNPDMSYPYTGGEIGVFGFDVEAVAVKPATSHDIMGYCSNEWISDYNYRAVLQYRGSTPDVVTVASSMVQPALMVWGRIEAGRMELYPSFQVTTRAVLPRRPGPYSIQARADDGSSLFDLSFDPAEVADDRQGQKQFAFAVPLPPDGAARLASIRLLGQGEQVSLPQSAGEAAVVRATRSGPGRVLLEWDAAKSPMVLVRDPGTGQILTFARGGRTQLTTTRPELSVTLSNRAQSRDLRISVPAR